MNLSTKRLIFLLMSLLMFVVMTACGADEVTRGPDVAATETALAVNAPDTPNLEPTATPTETPTQTPEPTATATPTPTLPPSPIETPTQQAEDETALDNVALGIGDLPAGFVAVPSTMLGLDDLALPETGAVQVPENIFAFLDQSQFRVVAGFVEELQDEAEVIAFDEAITLTLETFLQGVGTGLGMQELVDFELEELAGLEEIGDQAVGATTSIESEQASFQIDVVVFRRDLVEAVLIILYPQGLGEGLEPAELAQTLDQRIVEALEAGR